MEYSGAGGKLIHEKNQKQKISWHCPFNMVYLATWRGKLYNVFTVQLPEYGLPGYLDRQAVQCIYGTAAWIRVYLSTWKDKLYSVQWQPAEYGVQYMSFLVDKLYNVCTVQCTAAWSRFTCLPG